MVDTFLILMECRRSRNDMIDHGKPLLTLMNRVNHGKPLLKLLIMIIRVLLLKVRLMVFIR